MTTISLRRESLYRKTESLLTEVQNNAIRIKYAKANINNTQLNCKCKLSGDGDETVNHIISECSKLAQKEYQSRHDWVPKVIHWELHKELILDYTDKLKIHKPESVLENETDKILWDFEIQTDNLIPERRPVLINKKKKNMSSSGFSCRVQSENIRKRKEIPGSC